ncbi:bifunctional 5,10-methylenetetrahydrofolate dehydrogenase/5,10-methenyltetrahydrofolate cyclohydrolase [bacterium]|jgi:methylenetetrahydrofolate dehydrogenase (NADP+) / methenyltetrahydrofolate cyclohydrolase|nr:bifunctional 5,10-methylenetetrahydrofolate dehydrogenase/5,10-methenyltetrahydrofolate cyclohydrolase [bacterium]MBT4251041.1 bifunctional 5,10-methylenetetrahydrofolate dehydrogenase/5,10-methenyltetrahydrofolate cyclohydrolase [bacterium]MBT4597946.1 bifunctional 5,10-methylenetetrahydrofolate dehydrogenase/5,10-methenyltetrahydrofolate cyclohydrolase [bacterium]MBT6753485.1 bifunctional 5,10-methylenetetrahydrofolate dehydrogenase/5,10-methenyltetrahydrofolate cyclohydrolase [bacterium]M
MEILKGKKVADIINGETRERISSFEKKPVLVIVFVGDDSASRIYVKKKIEACKEVGIESVQVELPTDISEQDLLTEVETLNNDPSTDAILVQLPLPRHISERDVLNSITPKKDVECLCCSNFGRFSEYGETSVVVSPVTPMAVMKILDVYGIEIEGKNAVVVGNSNIVGKPVTMLLVDRGATVTVCHEKTRDIGIHTRWADILVVAVGKKHLIGEGMFKKSAVVIDVGINREDGKLFGDVDFEAAKKVVSAITPVPGGVGPVTVAMLMKNTVELFVNKQNK